jgi:sterol 3beta-glucosyltransferase
MTGGFVRIALLATGTRGDAQPMLVLADELRRRGHDTVLGLSPNVVALAERAGFTARGVGPDSQAVLESPQGKRWLAAGNAKAFLDEMAVITRAHTDQINQEMLTVCEGKDLIVAGILVEDRLAVVAEAQGVPLVCLHYAPLRRTSSYPPLLMTTRRLPRIVNVAAHALFERLWWQHQTDAVNQLRVQLGVAPVATSTASRLAAAGALELQLFSSVLTPKLKDYPVRLPILGFSGMPSELRSRLGESNVDPELDQWLAEGDPPAYFGFGSMPVTDPASMIAMITDTARRLRLRALIGAGWSQLDQFAGSMDDVRIVQGVLNFEQVFPRCRIAVHHGGSGTVAASVAAGIPTFVCSVFGDNAFWGARVEELRVGAHQPFSKLTPKSFEAGMQSALRPEVAVRSQQVGQALRRDSHGTERAAELVEQRASTV